MLRLSAMKDTLCRPRYKGLDSGFRPVVVPADACESCRSKAKFKLLVSSTGYRAALVLQMWGHFGHVGRSWAPGAPVALLHPPLPAVLQRLDVAVLTVTADSLLLGAP